jgi:hypothetical protein
MSASVAMKPSMVAMLGRIMPAPLLMPVMVTVCTATIQRCALMRLGHGVGGHDALRGFAQWRRLRIVQWLRA